MGNYAVIYVLGSALLLTFLALNVSRLRRALKIGNGDGANKQLYNAIRSHANAFEQLMPFFLLVLAIDQRVPNSTWLLALISSFLLVRLIHAWGMLGRVFSFRVVAAGLTYLLYLVAIAFVVALYFL
tara:strand:- start:973 stop:1353 length:381 start_codon:yes stop_codon:yes gene_type:complete